MNPGLVVFTQKAVCLPISITDDLGQSFSHTLVGSTGGPSLRFLKSNAQVQVGVDLRDKFPGSGHRIGQNSVRAVYLMFLLISKGERATTF